MHDLLGRLTARWATVTVTYGVLLVLVGTLFPYDFVFEENGNTFDRHFRFLGIGNPVDFIVNVLLFLPLGFGLTCLAQKRGLARRAELLVVIAAGALLSFCVEVSQVFLPSRFVSFVDVVSNTVGTVLGCLIFRFWGPQVLNYASILVQRINGFLTINVVMASFVGYAVLTILISIALQQATSLSNWDEAFPLLVGNEQTGDRPWRGIVYKLQIANKAASKEEIAEAFSQKGLFASIDGPLLASYDFTNGGSYRDQAGHLPKLVWKGNISGGGQGKGVLLGNNPWLETSEAAILLTREIRKTSQFTLSTTVATVETMQTGPARIVSLSEDPFYRNFTLGQSGRDLVFRLRTPLTGKNGTNPQLIARNVFADTGPHHLAITYDGTVLSVFVDGIRHRNFLRLNPEASLFSYLFTLNAQNMMGYKALYYALIFIPLGLLSGFMVTVLRQRLVIKTLGIAIGFLPAWVHESMLARANERLLNVENLFLSMGITAATLLLFSFLIVSERGHEIES